MHIRGANRESHGLGCRQGGHYEHGLEASRGYSTVSVYLAVQSTQQVIDLPKKTLDASDLRQVNASDGKIMHAELVALRSRNQYGKKVIRIGVRD